MLFQEEETILFCIHCQKETPHIVKYVNQTISSIECQNCQNAMTINVDAMQEFHQYVYERLVSKPGRMTEEARQDLSKFLASLPMRIISKPIRFSSEYTHLSKEVKEFMEHSQQIKQHEEDEYDD